MRKTSLLNRIYHASPCTASWEDMTGDDRVRFCRQCGQHVYNFSAMRRREAERLIESKDATLCARFLRRPDGSVITRTAWSPIREWAQHVQRVATTALSTFLGLSATLASAQNQPCTMPNLGSSDARLSYSEATSATFATITGAVHDTTNDGIEGTEIEWTRLGTGLKYKMVANKQGRFSSEQVEPGFYSVRVQAPGFQSYRAEEVRVRAGQNLHLDVNLAIGSMGGCALIPEPGSKNQWAKTNLVASPSRDSA